MISDTNEALKRKNFHLYTNNYIPFLISDEVWDYYMDLFEPTLHLRTEWKEWEECLSEFEDFNSFQKEYEAIVNNIKSDLSDFKHPNVELKEEPETQVSIKDGRYFSIDLRSAMMVVYNHHNIIKEKTWTEFIQKYSTKKYFNTKNFRFHVNRQICSPWPSNWIYEETLKHMYKILESNDSILQWIRDNNMELTYILGDNLLFLIPDDTTYHKCISKMADDYIIDNHYHVHLSVIEKETYLMPHNGMYFCSFKNNLNGTIKFLSDNPEIYLYLPQIQKKIFYNKNVNVLDLKYGVGDNPRTFKWEHNIVKI